MLEGDLGQLEVFGEDSRRHSLCLPGILRRWYKVFTSLTSGLSDILFGFQCVGHYRILGVQRQDLQDPMETGVPLPKTVKQPQLSFSPTTQNRETIRRVDVTDP